MAGGLTPDQRWAVIQEFGSPDNAVDEACRRSDEVSELWQTRHLWPQHDFWEAFWNRALPALGISRDDELEEAVSSPTSRKSTESKQGKWEGKAFSEDEVNKAAEIWVSNPGLTPWEVWKRYVRVRNPRDTGRLGRRKVTDLGTALDTGDARWDAEHERVEGLARSLSEPSRVLIPRY